MNRMWRERPLTLERRQQLRCLIGGDFTLFNHLQDQQAFLIGDRLCVGRCRRHRRTPNGERPRSGGAFSPARGETDTEFEFTVTYTDVEGDLPLSEQEFIHLRDRERRFALDVERSRRFAGRP